MKRNIFIVALASTFATNSIASNFQHNDGFGVDIGSEHYGIYYKHIDPRTNYGFRAGIASNFEFVSDDDIYDSVLSHHTRQPESDVTTKFSMHVGFMRRANSWLEHWVGVEGAYKRHYLGHNTYTGIWGDNGDYYIEGDSKFKVGIASGVNFKITDNVDFGINYFGGSNKFTGSIGYRF